MDKYPSWIAQSYVEILDRVRENRGAKLGYKDKDAILIEINSTKYLLRTLEELEIWLSIYVLGEYNIKAPFEYILIDVGMNVGITSLYFASQPNVKKIIGFEPLVATYNCLLENLAMNPQIAKKITHYNYGLGETDRKANVEYCFKYKGGVGILGLPEELKKDETWYFEEIIIRDAGSVFHNILRDYPQERFVCKMDCEGAEYEIFTSETFLQCLGGMSVVMLEYHRKGYEALYNILKNKGFEVFVLPDENGINGMLYAINLAKQ